MRHGWFERHVLSLLHQQHVAQLAIQYKSLTGFTEGCDKESEWFT